MSHKSKTKTHEGKNENEREGIEKQMDLDEMKEKMELEGRKGEKERSGRSKRRSGSMNGRSKSRENESLTRSLSRNRQSDRQMDERLTKSAKGPGRSRSPIKRGLKDITSRLGEVSLDSPPSDKGRENIFAIGAELRKRLRESSEEDGDEKEVRRNDAGNGSDGGEGETEKKTEEQMVKEVTDDHGELTAGLAERIEVLAKPIEALGGQVRPAMERWKKTIKKVKEAVMNEDGEEKEGDERVILLSPSDESGKREEDEDGTEASKWGLPKALDHSKAEYFASGHLSEVEEAVEEDSDLDDKYDQMTVDELIMMDTKMRDQFNQICDENDMLMESIAALKQDFGAQLNHKENKWSAKKEEYELLILDREQDIEKLEKLIEKMRGETLEAKTTKEMLEKKYAEAAVMMNTIEQQDNDIKQITAELEKEKKKRAMERTEFEEQRGSLDAQKREMESLRRMKNNMKNNMKKSDRKLIKRNPSMMSLNRGGEIMTIDSPPEDGVALRNDITSSSDDSEDEMRGFMRREEREREGEGRRERSREGRRREGDDREGEGRRERSREERRREGGERDGEREGDGGEGREDRRRGDGERRGRERDGERRRRRNKEMSRSEARRILRDYVWPSMSDFTTEEGFKAMFKRQIMRAKEEGIPSEAIASSVCNALIKNKKTADMFSELSEKFDTKTLSGVLKIIENLDSEQNSRNATERFYEIYMEDSDTARSYLGRLKRAHKALFPRERDGETNMIRKQFLEGFRHKGEELSEDDRRYLYNTPELDDLCTRTMYIVNHNLEKAKLKREFAKDRKDKQYRELNVVDYDMEATRQRKTESVQATYRGRPNNNVQAMPRGNQPVTAYHDNQNGQLQGPRQPPNTPRPAARQTQPRKPSAGPNAERVTEEEYRRGLAMSGETVCYKCCTKNHIATECPYTSFCVFCRRETDHPSKLHGDFMSRRSGRQINNL